MAKQPVPETSKLARARPLAYSRRQKTGADGGDDRPTDGVPEVEASAIPTSRADAPTQPPPPGDELWPDAPPAGRTRAPTISMPEQLVMGAPPEIPVATPARAAGALDELAFMPGPREIPDGNPDDPADPPGRVPSGDSRSLRRGNEFALVYRLRTSVISRFGVIGTRGQWRVVEYPTSTSAASSYAKECSRFVSEGFSDYRG